MCIRDRYMGLTKVFNLSCDTAYNGVQAIEKVEQKLKERKSCKLCDIPYRIIFMDCEMPVMDGLEATRILKGKMHFGEIPQMKVIACTAFAFQSELDKCTQAGMDDHVTKPINTQTLRQKLDKWLI
eukprot:TRINITY_DN9711_c0_g2_i4.p1 TRINITY_DN9711_c0_g2~~TRINITY_DN9711_c0_g2_i4.p1  ORF type:complete len:126 (+),score=2.73 TRINITY_DN9711_c0_g2_i4:79-456(+)